MPVTRPRAQGRQFSFRAHIIALVVAIVLPLTSLGVYSMLQLATAERAAEEAEIVSVARAVAAALDHELGQDLTIMRALAKRIPGSSAELEEFYNYCAALAQESGGSLLLADREGEQLFNTKRPFGTALPSLSGSPRFNDAVAAGVPLISNVFRGTVDQKPQYTIFMPLIDNGAVAHVLAMSFPMSNLNALLRAQHLPAEWAVSIIDRDGTIVAKPDEASPLLGQQTSPAIRSLSREQNQAFLRVSHKLGVPVDMGVARSAMSGWIAVVGIPVTFVEAPLRQAMWRFGLLGGALLLPALGAASLIGGHLSRAIRRLSYAANALAQREAMPMVGSTVKEVDEVARALADADAARTAGEDRLRRSQEHLAVAQRVSQTGSVLYDIANEYEEWSDELYRIYGVKRGEQPATFATVLALVPEEDRAKLVAVKEMVERGEQPSSIHYRLRRPDGDLRVIKLDVAPLGDGEGRSSQVVVTLRDVTELKATEEKLRRSQRHLALAQRLSHIGSVLHDIKSGADEWSDELYRILGVTPGEIPETFETFLEFVVPDDRPAVLANRTATLAGGERRPHDEYRVMRSDGAVRVIHSEVELLFGDAGRPSQLLITCADVTELRAAEQRERQLEQQLHHAQKLDALGTLAGGIAHDLNNTLVPVLTLTKLTMRRLPEASRERNNLATVLHAGERARDLVRQILAFSRKESPVRERVDLATLVRESLKMVRSTLLATIEIDEAITSAPPVLGDPGQLHQILMNLVVNAAQAIGDKMGKITVSLVAEQHCFVEAGGNRAGPALHLSVRDTGCGMDETTRRRIFEPFFTTKPVGEGTGLGLSVVHGIVIRHGGEITVDSQPGEGTCFNVYLPTVSREAAALAV